MAENYAEADMRNWKDMKTFFEELNEKAEYLVLRNFEEFQEEKVLSEHPDIDLLCEHPEEIIRITDAAPRGQETDLCHRKVLIGGEEIFLDIRSVGDGYYDSKWMKEMLTGRKLFQELCYVPSEEDYFYSLLYHGLVQKKEMSADYRKRLAGLAEPLGISSEEEPQKCLETYMREKGYFYTYPVFPGATCILDGADRALIRHDRKRENARAVYRLKKSVKQLLGKKGNK